MILTRLYELATRENLLDDPAFEKLPIPFVIELGDCGQFLGVSDTARRKCCSLQEEGRGGEEKARQRATHLGATLDRILREPGCRAILR